MKKRNSMSTKRRGALRNAAWCALAIAAVRPSLSLAHQDQPVTEKKHVVAPFEVIVSDFPATIELTIADNHAVTVRAQKHVHQQLSVEVVDGQLRIQSSGSFQTSQAIEIQVFARAVTGFKVGGAATVVVDALDAEQLEINGDGSAQVRISQLNLKRLIGDLQGASSMTLSGRVQEQQVRMNGSASFDGLRLVSSRGGFHIQGAANAVVNVTQRLQVQVSDAGSVEYTGNPAVTERIQGAGSLARR